MVGHRLSGSLVGMFEPNFFLFFSLLMPACTLSSLVLSWPPTSGDRGSPGDRSGAFGRLQLSRAEQTVCTLLQDALCWHGATRCSVAGGRCVPWGCGQVLCSGLGQRCPQASRVSTGWCREPSAVLRHAVNNGPIALSLGWLK